MNWNNIEKFEDAVEKVTKFVFTKDDAVVETVLYRYPTYNERTVICCSIQSGCPMGCRFCGTGDYFVRNLTEKEIVSQVLHAVISTGVEPTEMKRLQIMFMSMGEGFLNLKTLMAAIRSLHVIFPNAELLVSTAGPDVGKDNFMEFVKLSMEIHKVGLQFSIHESTNEKRNALIPFKRKMTLEQIAEHGEMWATLVGRKVFFNYCAHDKNSSNGDADNLTRLFDQQYWNATISVICERNDGMPTSSDFQKQLAVDFSSLLVERGYDVRVFDPSGQDTIGGGCGQLWYVQKWIKENQEKARPSIGHGKKIVHIPVKAI
jgi:23S rRNA (adenine2503-C2)-methyltransferase